ncbi:sodium-coupled monocarboxylate transporter 1 [Rhipicephalus sanguineus]|uniref:sodium-coupled monocarboxylate transporter 1 n=1 Tax=Rhipicephalus sanguineus TaxID=34632 RepID=UPI0020C367D2|nr:sodium-coupled monocarboxylate transporter 1 [Rhipicephalus sanguineus]
MDNVTLRSSAALVARFTPYDYAVFVCALLGSGAIGLYQAFAGGSGGSQSLQEMLTGGGQLPTVPVGTSLMASFISAAYLLGNASEIYTDGTMYFMVFLSYFLVIPVTAHLYMPVYYNLNVCTAYEYLELRFNRPIRFIAVAMFTVQMALYLSVSLYAPALALSKVMGMPLWAAVALLGIVCTVYTSTGGIKAVVYTDTFQCVVMFIAFIVVVSMGFQEVGGFENAWNIAKQGRRVVFNSVSSKLNVRHTIWGLIIGAWFTNSASYTTNQMMVLRYLTVKTLTRAKIVVWLNLPYLCLILLLSCLSGLMIYARYATCDPLLTKRIDTTDQLLPYFVMDVLADTTGVAGVFVTGIFMASLSSVSSGINALATVFYVDVIAILRPGIKESTGSYIMVALGVFFGILSIALVAVAEQLGDVLAAQSAINSGLGGPLLGLFSMGVFIPHVSSKGAMLGLLTSLGISLWISIGSLVNSPTYPSPPLSVDGCPALYRNVTNSSEPYIHPIITEEDIGDGVYSLSYLWQTLVAFLVSFVVGIPASFYATANDPKKMNPKLICPIVDVLFPYLPERFRRPFRFKLGQDYVAPQLQQQSQRRSQSQASVKTIVPPIDRDPKILGQNVSYIQALTEKLFPGAALHPVEPRRYDSTFTASSPFPPPTEVVSQPPPFLPQVPRRRHSSYRHSKNESSRM